MFEISWSCGQSSGLKIFIAGNLIPKQQNTDEEELQADVKKKYLKSYIHRDYVDNCLKISYCPI